MKHLVLKGDSGAEGQPSLHRGFKFIPGHRRPGLKDTKQNPTKLNQTKMSLRGQFSIKEEYIIPTLNSKSCLTEHQTELMIQKEKKNYS